MHEQDLKAPLPDKKKKSAIVIPEAEVARLLGIGKQAVKDARLKGNPKGRWFKKWGLIWYFEQDIVKENA